jgi:hypothetical protein
MSRIQSVRSVLAIGGEHADELLPIDTVIDIKADPDRPAGVTAHLANDAAFGLTIIAPGRRHFLMNQAVEYPGIEHSHIVERRQAHTTEALAAAADVAANIHASSLEGDMYAIIGRRAKPIVLQTLSYLGCKSAMILPDMKRGPMCIFNSNPFTLEIPKGHELDNKLRLKQRIYDIALQPDLPDVPQSLNLLTLAGVVSARDADEHGLPGYLPEMAELPDSASALVGYAPPLYALGWLSSGRSATRGEIAVPLEGVTIEQNQLVFSPESADLLIHNPAAAFPRYSFR